MYLDRLDEARETFAHALRSESRDEEMVEAVRFHSARLELRAGDWTRCRAHRSDLRAGRAGPRTPVRPPRVDPSADRCLRRRRERIGIRGRRRNGGRGSRDPGTEMQALLGFSSSRGGTPLSRCGCSNRCRRVFGNSGTGEPSHLQAIPNLVDAYIGPRQAGRRSSAPRMVRGATACARPPARPRSGRAVPGPAGGRPGDVDTAVAHFDAALDFGFPEPFENGRTLLARGIVLRRAARRRDARESLRRHARSSTG